MNCKKCENLFKISKKYRGKHPVCHKCRYICKLIKKQSYVKLSQIFTEANKEVETIDNLQIDGENIWMHLEYTHFCQGYLDYEEDTWEFTIDEFCHKCN